MKKKYFIPAWRAIIKNKGYAAVHIIGLSLGISACALISFYVWDEWNYDRFHQDHEKTFRVTTVETEEGVTNHVANTYLPISRKLNSQMPEIHRNSRLLPYSVAIAFKRDRKLFQEDQFFFADSVFFELFNFHFLNGDRKTALDAPNSVVITEETSHRYFGTDDPMGKILVADNSQELLVTGVVQTPPINSTIQFSMIANMEMASPLIGNWIENDHSTWYYPPVYTFIQFEQPVDGEYLSTRMDGFYANHLPDHLADKYRLNFQPLAKMHFRSLSQDLSSATNPRLLWILMGAALIILLMACINYINLSFTKLMDRFQEVGIRKVLGAGNREIFYQIGAESLLYLLISILTSLTLVRLLLPSYNQMLGKSFNLWSLEALGLSGGLLLFLLIIVIFISLLPALAFNKYKVISTIHQKWKLPSRSGSPFNLRRTLIVTQFAIATILIISTIAIRKQLFYIQKKDLGIRSEQVLVVPIRSEQVQNDFEPIKNEFRAINGVNEVSAISNFPWESGYYNFQTTMSGGGKDVKTNLSTLLVDEDFVQAMGINLKSGRSFAKDISTDKLEAFLINETARTAFDFPLDTELELTMHGLMEGDDKKGKVIGIMEDFHLKSLHQKVEPLAITITNQKYFLDNFVMQVETGNIQGTLADLEEVWNKHAPTNPFEYFFLDESFEQLYLKESRMGMLFAFFTLIAILIGCMGMFALASATCAQRTKEIGIRKVLGGTFYSVVTLISKEFVALVLIALLISIPISYYFIRNWLENYAYHIEISLGIFVLGAGIALTTAVVTVLVKTSQAVLRNPVDSLRDD